MDKFDQTICLEQAVETVEKQADGIFKLVTNQEIHYSKTIIITAGNGAFQPRKLELDSAESFEGSNLHYFINDLNQFAGRRVAVLGAETLRWTGHLCLNQSQKKYPLFTAAINSAHMSTV